MLQRVSKHVLQISIQTDLHKKYFMWVFFSFYRSVLTDSKIKNPSSSACFIKIMLLYRRYATLISINTEESDVYDLASKLQCPSDLVKFLKSLKISELYDLKRKNFVKKFLKKKLKKDSVKELLQVCTNNFVIIYQWFCIFFSMTKYSY